MTNSLNIRALAESLGHARLVLGGLVFVFGMMAPLSGIGQGVSGSALPQLGDASALSTAQERKIGDRVMRDLYRDPLLIDDPVLSDHVDSLWQSLLDSARLRGELTPELQERFAWRVMLLRDRSVNAFALPGGYLGLHLGLLASTSSRDELASVLGHELSHVTQRHISRMIGQSKQQAPLMAAAMVLGVLAASKSADAANALIVGGQALGIQGQLNFSRDMEREADRIGFGVVTQAGFKAQGFVDMFDKLQQAARLNDTGAFPYLRTHPLSTERMADMQARIPPQTAPGKAQLGDLTDALMAARASTLISPDASTLATAQAVIADHGLQSKPIVQQVAAFYAGALAASSVRRTELARQYVRELKRRLVSLDETGRVSAKAKQQLIWLEAEVDLAARDLSADALTALLQSLSASGDRGAQAPRPLLMLQAQAALQIGAPAVLRRASQDLQIRVLRDSSDALAWQILSQLHAALKLDLRSLRDAAEAQAAQFNYPAALDRLRAAQTLSRKLGPGASAADQIEASIVDTRYRQIDALVRAQAREP